MKRSWSRLKLPAILLVAILFFLLFHEWQLSGYDPANFVLAIKYGYSVAARRPHAPGYPGFYLLWKGIEQITHLGPYEVILATNLIFFLIAVSLTYLVSRKLFDERIAVFATVLAVSNPLLLYFACTAELYVYDAAFSAFLVLLLLVPPRKFETALYFLYGLLGAFRLSSVILTFPVVFIALYMRYRREKTLQPLAMDVCAVMLGTLAWLLPFVYCIGGWRNYFSIARGVTLLPTTTVVQNLSAVLPVHLWMMNILLIVIAANIKKIWSRIRLFDNVCIVLILLILIPGLFFALKFYTKGYALLYLTPIAMIGTRAIVQSSRRVFWAISAIGINLLIFFAVPFKGPSVRSDLSHANRTMSERWSSELWRCTSFFAPTLEHLRMNDRMMAASRSLLDSVAPESSYIIVDASAAVWAFPRSLQALYPQTVFLLPHSEDSIYFQYYSKDSINETFELPPLSRPINLYYLSTAALRNEMGKPPGSLLRQNGTFMLYAEPTSSRDSLRHYLKLLFFSGTP
jgi:hypothetical protein